MNSVRFAVSRAFALSEILPAAFPRLLAIAKARNPSADGSGLFSQAGTGDGATICPQWLRLRKANGVITAYQSDDGTSYTPVGKPQSYAATSPTTYAGIAISSGDGDGSGEVRFDATTSITIE